MLLNLSYWALKFHAVSFPWQVSADKNGIKMPRSWSCFPLLTIFSTYNSDDHWITRVFSSCICFCDIWQMNKLQGSSFREEETSFSSKHLTHLLQHLDLSSGQQTERHWFSMRAAGKFQCPSSYWKNCRWGSHCCSAPLCLMAHSHMEGVFVI